MAPVAPVAPVLAVSAQLPLPCEPQAQGSALGSLEAEGQSWKLRCLHAETHLRLLRQQRRGERNDKLETISLEVLRKSCSQLETSVSQLLAQAQAMIQETVQARLQAVSLEGEVKQRESQAEKFREECAQLADECEGLRVAEVFEDEAFREKEEGLKAFKDSATASKHDFQDLTDLAFPASLVFESCRRLEEELNAHAPLLLDLEAVVAEAEAFSSRAKASSAKREEHWATVEGRAEAEGLEEGREQEEKEEELEKCREELAASSALHAELTEAARKLTRSHGQKLSDVKKTTQAMRSALASAGPQRQQLEEELQLLRYSAQEAALLEEEQLLKHRTVALAHCALLDSVAFASGRLLAAEEAKEALLEEAKPRSELAASRKAEGEAEEALRAALGAERRAGALVGQLRSQVQQFEGKRGVEVEPLEALQAEQLELEARCEALRQHSGLSELRRQREQQLLERRAVQESALRLRARLAELRASLGAPSRGDKAKALMTYLEDFLAFFSGWRGFNRDAQS